MVTIIAVGDIMPGGVLNSSDKQYVSEDVKRILSDGDLRVGTLETAIGNKATFYVEKMTRKADVIYAEDDDLKRLVELNVNVVSLANNHFFDLGPEGAEHTIELLEMRGIKHCGAGRNIEEASKPAVVTIDGKTIAFLAYCDWREETTGWCPFATETSAGVAPLYDDFVVEQIQRYRPFYDYIVVIPHWGIEYNYKPSANVYRTSQRMLTAGADLILGGHTHCVQPIVNKDGKSIVFSMGNFLFPDRLICPPRSTYYPHPVLDIDTLPVTYEYPYVNTVTFKKWNQTGRRGMIVTSELTGDGISSTCSYTFLTDENLVTIAPLPESINAMLNKIHTFLCSGYYLPILFIRRCLYLMLHPKHLFRMIKQFFTKK